MTQTIILSKPSEIYQNLYELYCSPHTFRSDFENNPQTEYLRNRLKDLRASSIDCEFISELALQRLAPLYSLLNQVNWDLLRDTIPAYLRQDLFCNALPCFSSTPLNTSDRERIRQVLMKYLAEMTDLDSCKRHQHKPSWSLEKLDELQDTCRFTGKEKEFFDSVMNLESAAALAKIDHVQMKALKEGLPFSWKRDMIDCLVSHIVQPLHDNPLRYQYGPYLESQRLLEKLAQALFSPEEFSQVSDLINQGLNEKTNHWTGFQRTPSSTLS